MAARCAGAALGLALFLALLAAAGCARKPPEYLCLFITVEREGARFPAMLCGPRVKEPESPQDELEGGRVR